MIWSQLKVKFAPLATTLGAAIIAHGTMAGDVTYVPWDPAYWQIAIHFNNNILQPDCNELFVWHIYVYLLTWQVDANNPAYITHV